VHRSYWFGLVVLLLTGLGLAFGGGLARGAGSQPDCLILRDEEGDLTLRVQIEPNAANAGAFSLRVPGGQVYAGTLGSAMTIHSSSSITVNYAGSAVRYPALDQPSANLAPTTVAIALQGQLNPGARTGQVILDDGPQHFHLQARGGARAPALTPTLNTFEQAVRQGNWGTVYGLLMSEITAANTQADFVAKMAQADAALGPVVAVRRGSVGQAEVSDLGVITATVVYSMDRRAPGGATSTTAYDATFVLEGTAWKLWYMDEH
jgi:hypothetical protein